MLEESGATAIATGSWSVAAAQGFEDGEVIPLDFVLTIMDRIVQSTSLPLTVDFEGGYAEDPALIETNTTRMIAAGVAGMNFEDQVVKGQRLYTIAEQTARIKAVRNSADAAGLPLFLNARTDLFLKPHAGVKDAELMGEALSRQAAYEQAGADGFFVPGLTDSSMISELCEKSSLPVNIMITEGLSSAQDMAQLGVARVSFGPRPFFNAIADLQKRFATI